MMDIIVTTPKSQMANAAQEAADCIAANGGEYFRRFAPSGVPRIHPGERVWYVEDGFIRGFCMVVGVKLASEMKCATTGREWPAGHYVIMDATRWYWIKPIPMKGFQGFRYVRFSKCGTYPDFGFGPQDITFMGGWRDPRPGDLQERNNAQPHHQR